MCNSDLSVLEMSFIQSSNKHMGVQDVELLAEKYGKRIISTHMSQEVRVLAKEKKISKLVIPNDGDEFEI